MPSGATVEIDHASCDGRVARERRVPVGVDACEEAKPARPSTQLTSAITDAQSNSWLCVAR
jgi:hypothetical protein